VVVVADSPDADASSDDSTSHHLLLAPDGSIAVKLVTTSGVSIGGDADVDGPESTDHDGEQDGQESISETTHTESDVSNTAAVKGGAQQRMPSTVTFSSSGTLATGAPAIPTAAQTTPTAAPTIPTAVPTVSTTATTAPSGSPAHALESNGDVNLLPPTSAGGSLASAAAVRSRRVPRPPRPTPAPPQL
jgi:hypothetical protein